MREKIELLQEELLGLQLAAGHLGYSMERCHNLIGREDAGDLHCCSGPVSGAAGSCS